MTSDENCPSWRPALTLTAPISVIRASSGDQPVVSTSTMDPSFTIDGSAYSAYHIAYSSGIGSQNTVPLPASLPLFGSGLCALGFFGRRRQKAAGGANGAA